MKPTTIYLVRHGQTEWNLEHRMQGHQDSPLTELGVRQAVWLGEALRHETIDALYASSSGRAYRTAELIRRERDVPVQRCDDLKEIHLGVWEGQTQASVQERDPEQYDLFWKNPGQFRIEGGETFHEVRERALGRLLTIVRDHPGQSVLIVTHTVVVKLLMAYAENRPLHLLWELPYIHPACLCKLHFKDGEASILLHGDTSHYQEAREAEAW